MECENSPTDKQKVEIQKKIDNILYISNFSDTPCDTKSMLKKSNKTEIEERNSGCGGNVEVKTSNLK